MIEQEAMMEDRQLIELAAKAARMAGGWKERVSAGWGTTTHGFFLKRTSGSGKLWNPLTDDGDALRLAVKLGISIDRAGNRCWAFASGMAINGVCEEFYKDAPYAATRRAIVRAAAAMATGSN